ncbi:MAG: hypothetical protein WCT39_03175 [Candidatus Margulisiibacteriota bacterium]
MIFIVSKDLKSVEKSEQEGFQDMNLWERQHIEEWIRKAPEILGEELLVVGVEFDQFSVSRDRLDLLAVDRQGKLVVVEIKRDSAAGYADLQAVRYAAMVSSMTVESLAPHYLGYLRKYMKEDGLTLEMARNRIVEFVEAEDFEELSTKPRIILCSEDFSREVTTTVLWLRQFDIDISCVRFSPYRVGDKIVIVPTKVIPLPEAEEYQVKIQKKREDINQSGDGKKRARTMQILLDNEIIKGGERVFLKNSLPSHLKFKEGDPTFSGVLTGKSGQRNAITWDKDQKEYSISKLAWMIFRDLHPDKKDPGGVNGSWHWVLKNGKSLWTLAEETLAKQQKPVLTPKG